MGSVNFSQKAYNILKEEEKLALNLQLVGGKSSWDAGQIIRKSHYKYLEIKARAQKFLELFTIHYNTFGSLVPDGIRLNPSLQTYFEKVIEDRMKISEAVAYVENKSFIASSIRNRSIITEMEKLKSINSASSIALYELILNFDKFNNFRILPKELQEPSAFKRRNKNVHKKHIQTMLRIGEQEADYIEAQFSTDRAKKVLYTYLITDVEIQLYKIITVKDTKDVRKQITEKGLYLFKNQTKVSEFCRLIVDFYSKDNKHCTDGQRFWPMYRDFVKYAINYREMNNMSTERGHEWLHQDYDLRRLPGAKKQFGQQD